MVIKCKFLQRGNVEKFYCSSVSENNNNSRHYRVVKALYHHLIRNFIFNVQFINPYSHTSLSYLLTVWNKVKRREIKSLHLTLFNAVHWQAWNKVVTIFTIHNRFRLINWTFENKNIYWVTILILPIGLDVLLEINEPKNESHSWKIFKNNLQWLH